MSEADKVIQVLSGERRIEYLPLEQLQPATRNPKRHAEPELDASLDRFGYAEPMMLDERTGRLVAGHGRLESLRRLREKGGEPPEGVRVEAGKWVVPVVRGWGSFDDKEAEAYLVASNQLTIAGGWDHGELAQLLRSLDGAAEGVGFSSEELSRLLDSVTQPGHAGKDADDASELPKQADTWVKRGDLFELEGHRILCGDSTKGEDVAALMGKDRARICWTDPPYNISYDDNARRRLDTKRPKRKAIENDETSDEFRGFCSLFLAEMKNVLHAGAHVYLAMANDEMGTVMELLKEFGFHYSSTIIWVKDQFNLGAKDYHPQHEAIWYGWKGDSARLVRLEDRTQSDVWNIARPKRSEEHPTMKPVELVVRSLKNSSRVGDLCYEPFSGSGTTMMACEATGRRCRAIELDPRYVQVALERWTKWTGRKPHKVT